MKKAKKPPFLAPLADPPPPVLPEIDAPTIEEELDSIRINITEAPAKSRTRRGGSTRLTSPAVALFKEVGRRQNKEPLFQWVMVKQGRLSGSLFLVPTDESNPDKVQVHWYEAGREVAFSLGRVLTRKKIHVPRGVSLVMDCKIANLKNLGAALELQLGKARLESVNQKGEIPGTTETAAAHMQ